MTREQMIAWLTLEGYSLWDSDHDDGLFVWSGGSTYVCGMYPPERWLKVEYTIEKKDKQTTWDRVPLPSMEQLVELLEKPL